MKSGIKLFHFENKYKCYADIYIIARTFCQAVIEMNRHYPDQEDRERWRFVKATSIEKLDMPFTIFS